MRPISKAPVAPPGPMTHTISVSHRLLDGSGAELVNLAYRIDNEDDVRIVACEAAVPDRDTHRWLMLRKFDMRMRLHPGGKYTLLHTDRNDRANRDTTQFIDEVWEGIIEKEGWVLAAV